MQTTCAVLTPRVVWCRATAPAGLSKLCQLLALSAWHFIAQGRSESSSKEQISARAFRSEVRVWYQPKEESQSSPIAPRRYTAALLIDCIIMVLHQTDWRQISIGEYL